MPRLTADQVKSLAPDPASYKAGQGLAAARHWESLGRSDAALWGECKGSAKEPYKVRVDLSNNGSACTCPSRKFPCKHVIGLLLLASTSPGELTESSPPPWVADWLEKRATRDQAVEKRPANKPSGDSGVKDAARRAAKREKLAGAGIETLERWLADFARRGLAFAQGAPASFWDEQAARMVDAQLPGAARLIRDLRALPGSQPDWAEVLLLRLGRLSLLARAYRKLDALPADTQADVRSLLGWNVQQEDLLASAPALADDWLVASLTVTEDGKSGLRTQECWLLGRQSRRPAQILNFAHRTQPLDASLAPGMLLQGELVYFPGAYPLRAVFKDKRAAGPGFIPSGVSRFADLLDQYAAALGKNPWIEAFPAVLENVIPVDTSQLSAYAWSLCDAQGQGLPLSRRFAVPWELLAVSGGRPLPVFGTWDGFTFTPLAAWRVERPIAGERLTSHGRLVTL